MRQDPLQVLHAAVRAQPAHGSHARLLIAGATGALGHEVLHRLAGTAMGGVEVLAREPMRAGLRGVAPRVVPSDAPGEWPQASVDTGIVLFDPPRLFYQRERALWAPRPEQLPALAGWLRRSGAHTLAVVLPHAQGRLPAALQHGLASLDEQAVAALGFERLIFIRSPQKPAHAQAPGLPQRVARFMLSAFQYMVPASEQPVRAACMAELLAVALHSAPSGIHIAAPELVWRAGQGDLRAVAAQWLRA